MAGELLRSGILPGNRSIARLSGGSTIIRSFPESNDIQMGTIFYFFREAVRGFYQAKLMTFVSIASIAVSLFIFTCIVIALLNVNRILHKSTDQADLAAYLTEITAADSEATEEVMNRIRNLPSVRQIHFIDKDSAWERFANLYGNDMLESVDDNPLPASVEIYLKEDNRSQEDALRVADLVGGYAEIESVRYSREWIDLVQKFWILFWIAVFFIAVVFMFILYFMISNTIKLTIYARRELVAHMQVVGATAFFIQMPFILEGVLQGLVGGLISVVATGLLHIILLNTAIYWGPALLPALVIFVGVVFGWFGSTGAVRKFLV